MKNDFNKFLIALSIAIITCLIVPILVTVLFIITQTK